MHEYRAIIFNCDQASLPDIDALVRVGQMLGFEASVHQEVRRDGYSIPLFIDREEEKGVFVRWVGVRHSPDDKLSPIQLPLLCEGERILRLSLCHKERKGIGSCRIHAQK